MTKKLLNIILTLFFAQLTYGQSSAVLDASVVNERFWIHRDYIDIGYDLCEYTNYLLHGDSLQLSSSDISKLSEGQFNRNQKTFGIDYCYLFDEQYTWALRAFRTIDLKNQKNEYFIKGSRRIHNTFKKDGTIRRDTIYFDDLSLLNIIEKELKIGFLTPHQFSYFNYDTSFKSTINIDTISEIIKYIKIKEDWRYDKEKGSLKCFPIGLALLDKDKKETMWLYFPELRYSIYQEFISYKFPEDYSKSWNTIIEEHYYETESIQLEHHRNHQVGKYFDEDYNEHRNEFNSLFQLELINNHIKRNYFNHTGFIKDKLFDGRIISGELVNGLKKGKWQIQYENGNKNITIQFENNIPHGAYIQRYMNGRSIINGKFKFGLKDGIWLSNFENGKLMAKRRFNLGMLNGKQQTWYESGQKHLDYYFNDNKLNGSYERWNQDGVLTEKGYFKDDYFEGNWTIALRIPEIYIEIIKTNPNHKWGFEVSALSNGYLNYSVEIEQINDLNFCSINTCLKRVSMSKIK